MTKELIHQEYLTSLNVYAANNRVSGHMKQQLTELNGEINKLTVILGD